MEKTFGNFKVVSLTRLTSEDLDVNQQWNLGRLKLLKCSKTHLNVTFL